MSDTEVFCQSVPIRDSFSEVLQKNDDIIVFNVGGTKFEVLKSNFAYWPTTRLSRLVRANTEEEILSLCEGFVTSSHGRESKKEEYYFHRNWSNFNSILDLYRNTKLHATIHVCCTNFHGDLKYWGIDELLLDPCCALKHYPELEQSKKEVSRQIKVKKKEEDRKLYEDFGDSWIGEIREGIWNLTEHPVSSIIARVS
jgi:potassium voltage-gated channel Shaw-related subfamily C protein